MPRSPIRKNHTTHYDNKGYSACGISSAGIRQVGDDLSPEWERVNCDDCKTRTFVGARH